MIAFVTQGNIYHLIMITSVKMKCDDTMPKPLGKGRDEMAGKITHPYIFFQHFTFLDKNKRCRDGAMYNFGTCYLTTVFGMMPSLHHFVLVYKYLRIAYTYIRIYE